MDSAVPTCHRTIGPATVSRDSGNDFAGASYSESDPCLGSRCSAWSPRPAPVDAPTARVGTCGLVQGGRVFVDPNPENTP